MNAPLSTHSVHVPPRQTVHVAADLPADAQSIVLTKVAWAYSLTPEESKTPREALFLGVGDTHALAPGATSLSAPSKKIFDVTVGNWSDTTIVVSFEIWGKP